MTMAFIWTGMVVISLLCGLKTGRLDLLGGAAMAGAGEGVRLCLSMAGAMCLWMGVMEVMRRSGLAEKLSHLLRPLLGVLYPDHRRDEEAMADISANVSANLLGLGNAATPFGVRAARRMAGQSGGRATRDLIMLIVCNTASIQLIPVTVAAVRGAAGAPKPFDILPAVWLASVISVVAGIGAVRIFGFVWERRGR